ncbi:zinc finger, C2H2 type, partial [Cooperia oncophora]
MIVEHSSQESYVAGTECGFCNSRRKKKSFQRYSAYVAHVKSHMKPDQYFCGACQEEFTYFTLFQRHRRITHGATDTEDIPRGFSFELGFCPHCGSLIALDQIETHRLLHQLHNKLGKGKRVPSRKRNVPVENEVADVSPTTESNGKRGGRLNFPPRRPRKTHACPQCNKIFQRPAEVKRHAVVHAEVREKWKCSQCDSEFSHKAGLVGHKKAVHDDPLNAFVTCKICNQTFAKQSNLNRHIKKQHPIQIKNAVVDCPECSCVFVSHASLTRHRRMIHGTMYFPPFRCPTCSRTFIRGAQLRRHLLVHNASEAEKPFSCNRCHKRFNLKSTLKLHMDVHSRKDVDDPILTNPKCPVCMKHLSSRNALRKHMAVHERNYECSVCFQVDFYVFQYGL